ncbi:DUF1259 domain-containing protein [Bacillus haynesii]|uniref:DUF1259 domain-containing protein n=1 Tax=Bacillus haynesii TaxID=1925021 RepID=UPI001F6147DA|nr:DUF1259 domain-containing protein [Bacillus haynesii]MCI4128734.1 DUF1259 domain-containing protein [Bacillus haynesii]
MFHAIRSTDSPLIYLSTELREFGIIVTAVHNHWLFDKPRLSKKKSIHLLVCFENMILL